MCARCNSTFILHLCISANTFVTINSQLAHVKIVFSKLSNFRLATLTSLGPQGLLTTVRMNDNGFTTKQTNEASPCARLRHSLLGRRTCVRRLRQLGAMRAAARGGQQGERGRWQTRHRQTQGMEAASRGEARDMLAEFAGLAPDLDRVGETGLHI